MSKIEEMIKELCPKGVKKVKLGDVCNISRGKRVVRKDLETVGKIPVFQNSLVPLGYYSKSNCPAETTFVISAGAAGVIGISDTPFWAADDCFIVESTQMEDKFIYNFLKTKEYYLQSKIRGGAIKRLAKEPLEALEIPLPPLAIQQEIVSVLDSFTTLIDKMKKEVEMRKKQMEVYREKLLSFKDGDCEWKIIGSCINHLRTGLNPRVHFKLNTPDADGYYITVRELKGFKFEPDEKTDRINHEAVLRINERSNLQIGDVLFSGTGTIGRTAYVDKEPTNWNIKEGVYAITPNKDIIDSIYLIHCLLSQKFMEEVEQKAGGSTVRSISMMDFKNIKIPVPPLSVQQEIVRTLDAFETYISKLEKLITLRQKQYEYYREKLLTFE